MENLHTRYSLRSSRDRWRPSAPAAGDSPPCFPPVLFLLSLHRRCIRVLHFDPIGRAPRTVGRVLALRHDAFEAELARVPKHDVARFVDPLWLDGRLLSHTEPNYSGCCATFGPGGSLKGSRTFLANGRNKYFAIIASDSISRPFDVTQSACLPRITFRAGRPRRAGWTLRTRRS